MILVTGASGFIGARLVEALVDAGRPVRAMVRSEQAAAPLRDSGAQTVAADIRDVRAVRQAADGCDLVYHLAGPYRGSAAEMWTTHVDGTGNLLQACDPDTHVVYAGSTSVYGWDGPWPADEDTPTRPAGVYGRAKLAAEAMLDLRIRAGTATVLRSTMVYGPGDTRGMIPRAYGLLRRGLRVLPGTGANRIHLLHVDDLVAAMLAADAVPGLFVVCGPAPDTMAATMGTLADAAGFAPPVFAGAVPAVRAGARVLEAGWGLGRLPGEPPLTEHSVDVVTRDRAFTSQRARRELGWTPRTGLREGLAQTAAWLSSPPIRPASIQPVAVPGPEWRDYLDDPDEGLGTVYERFALQDLLQRVVAETGARSVLHAPLFGMTGVPGLDCAMLARDGIRIGLLDVDADRLDAVAGLWKSLGLEAAMHLASWPDLTGWEDAVAPESYDLVYSFAALWWAADPRRLLQAQAAWKPRAILVCVPNPNVFMRVRSSLWHREQFRHLNRHALDTAAIATWGREAGYVATGEGTFDLPPFPDTAVPLAKVLRSRSKAGAPAAGAWRWSIVPYLNGEQPGLESKVRRLGIVERRAPRPAKDRLAHHRFVLLQARGPR